MEDAYQVLSSPDIPGATKHDILAPLVEGMVLHKDGVEVIFAPGLFDEAGDKDGRSNCYTTCMVCRVGNGLSSYTLRNYPLELRTAV